MENKLNKLLLRQIKRHFGTIDPLPEGLLEFIRDINNTYENFEEDTQLLQNSIEISSQELREAFQKHKLDAETQKGTINKIKAAIYALNPVDNGVIMEGESFSSDSSYLFSSLIKLIEERKKAEEEILKLSKAVEQNPASIVITNTAGDIEYVNPKFCNLTGYTKEEVIGKNPRILKSDSTPYELYINLWNTILSGNEWQGELQNKKKNGEHYWESALISPIINENRQITHFIAIKEDISERKKAEEALKQSSQKWEAIISASPDGIGMISINGKLQLMSEKLALIHGYSIDQRDEYLDKTIFDFVDPSNHKLLIDNIHKLLSGEKGNKITEYLAVRQDQSRFFIDVNSSILYDVKGNPQSILFVERDITERKLAEETLQTKTSLLEAQTNATIDGILIVANDQKRVLINQRAVDLFDIPQYILDNEDDSLLLNHVMALTKYPEIFLEKVMYLNEHWSEISQDEFELISGKVLDRYSAPVLGKDGKNYGRIWTFRDITKNKQAEELLQNERALFRTIIDLIPDAVYVKDTQGRKILANPKEVQFAGKKSEDEIIGKTDENLYPDIAAQQGLKEDQFVLQTGKSILDVEGTLIDNNGKLHSLLISKVPLRDVHGKITGLVGVTHDISSRKKAEDDLKQISTRLSLAVRAGGVGVWDLDLIENFLLWDDQMFSLYGMDRSSAGLANEIRIAGIHPDDAVQIDNLILQAIRGEKEFDTEFRVIWPDQSVHNIRALATVQRDDSGKPLHIIGTNWDITEQKKTEATLLIAKEESDSANKAKSEFLANMSHEIRTPLNGVIGFTDLLLRSPLNKIQQQYAKNANTSGHSLLGIINDILDFSKIEAGKMELDWIKADIIELAELSSDIVKYHASQKDIELLLNIQQDIPRFAVIDPTRLKQILVNLLSNAVKFTETGEVELKVTFDKRDESSGNFNFSVRDTGIGISEEQQKQLFKAFTQADTSTTRKFGGTGLGLTISNMLAEKMGTRIEVISEQGKGSTFFFTLITDFEIGEKFNFNSLTSINRLMVIDDNYNNRMILEHTCKNWGIEFVGVENGYSAIELIKASKPFDVIIVDYQMPDLNGLDTIRTIREDLNLTPDKLPIILLHSSSDDIQIYEACKKMGVIFNLTKPVKSSELLHYLESIHHQPDPTSRSESDVLGPINIALAQKYAPVVLVAEDVVINMILVTTLIRKMVPNAIILEAKNGKEAFEMTLSKKPDLIIMDIQMPEMSGIEATRAIRNYEIDKEWRIPIVALTAGAVKGEKERCLEAGMDGFLTKPLDHNRLHNILEKYLNYFSGEATILMGKEIESQGNIHFDRMMVMESIGNSEAIFAELLEAIELQFGQDIELLGKAIDHQNLLEIKMIAHSIKGASLNMWFNKMAELAIEFELYLDKDHFSELDNLYKALILEWEIVQDLLKKSVSLNLN